MKIVLTLGGKYYRVYVFYVTSFLTFGLIFKSLEKRLKRFMFVRERERERENVCAREMLCK